MAKLSKQKLSKMGSEIMKIAARIRKNNPRKMWKECVRQAGEEYRKNK
jgi:hypothetical protein